MRNKALNDFCNAKLSFRFTSKYKAIWRENLAIYQKSLRAFFQAPLQLEQEKQCTCVNLTLA